MRVALCAVGRLRAGPEKALLDDYTNRFNRTGRALGLGPLDVFEVETRKAHGPHAEAELLLKSVPAGAMICALDERGQQLTSPQFAARLEGWRDQGGQVAFVIGGADGLAPQILDKARAQLSLGKMVWPHMLARVMLAEQLYRAASILAGAPYHRA